MTGEVPSEFLREVEIRQLCDSCDVDATQTAAGGRASGGFGDFAANVGWAPSPRDGRAEDVMRSSGFELLLESNDDYIY